MNRWASPNIRDEIVAFVEKYSAITALPVRRLIEWIDLTPDRFYQWRKRRGKPNRHNAPLPKKHWIEAWEREAIIEFYLAHQEDGYRRVTWMMIDADVVAVSPSTVYRVLKSAGLLRRKNTKPSKKGQGFNQPSKPHKHWHIDVSYINIAGTFYYFCGIIDGYSRAMIHWEIREAMKESDIEIILQRAHEKHPEASPRIISDNGPQFIAKEFKTFIRLKGMTHVRCSPFYPQSNGKIERFHRSLKHECVRPKTPVDLDDARRVIGRYIAYYNDIRLHGAIGYIAPSDKLAGRAEAIHTERERKLQAAKARRQAQGSSGESDDTRRMSLTPVLT